MVVAFCTYTKFIGITSPQGVMEYGPNFQLIESVHFDPTAKTAISKVRKQHSRLFKSKVAKDDPLTFPSHSPLFLGLLPAPRALGADGRGVRAGVPGRRHADDPDPRHGQHGVLRRRL